MSNHSCRYFRRLNRGRHFFSNSAVYELLAYILTSLSRPLWLTWSTFHSLSKKTTASWDSRMFSPWCIQIHASHSGRVVAHITMMKKIPGLNLTAGSCLCVFIMTGTTVTANNPHGVHGVSLSWRRRLWTKGFGEKEGFNPGLKEWGKDGWLMRVVSR